MMKEKLFIALIIIITGVTIAISSALNANLVNPFILLPCITFLVGILLYVWNFQIKKHLVLLILAPLFTFCGLILIFNVLTSYMYLGFLWPLFLLPAAISIYSVYYFKYRIKYLLIPVYVLTAVSFALILGIFLYTNLYSFPNWANIGVIVGAIVTLLGLFLLFKITPKSSD